MKTGLSIVLLAGAMFLAAPARAHHSFAMFEPEKEITLVGTVVKMDWANPHVWFYVMVNSPSGQPEQWGIESGATTTMMRAGWKRTSIKPGDKVSVVVRPTKDGSHSGSLRYVTLPNGEVLYREAGS